MTPVRIENFSEIEDLFVIRYEGEPGEEQEVGTEIELLPGESLEVLAGLEAIVYSNNVEGYDHVLSLEIGGEINGVTLGLGDRMTASLPSTQYVGV